MTDFRVENGINAAIGDGRYLKLGTVSPTISASDWLDQAVKTTSSPTFAGETLSHATQPLLRFTRVDAPYAGSFNVYNDGSAHVAAAGTSNNTLYLSGGTVAFRPTSGGTTTGLYDVTNGRLRLGGNTSPVNTLDVTGIISASSGATGGLYVFMPPPTLNTITAGTGGSPGLANGTYYYVLTAIDQDSGQTLPSQEYSITLSGSNNKVTLDFTYATNQPHGAVSIKIYRSAVSGQYTSPSLVATVTTGSSYVDQGAALTSGAPPTVGTAYGIKLRSQLNTPSLWGSQLILSANSNWANAILTVMGFGGTGNGVVNIMRPSSGRWASLLFTTGLSATSYTQDWAMGTYYFQGNNVTDFAFYGGSSTIANAPAYQNIGLAIRNNAGRFVGIGRITYPNQQLQVANGDIAVNLADPTNVSGTITLSGGSLADATYYYFVTAYNADGETAPLNNYKAIVSGGGGAAHVDLSWTASASPAGSVTGYKIYRSTVAGIAVGGGIGNTYIGTTTGTTFTDTGIAASAGGVVTCTAYINRLNPNGLSYINGGGLSIGYGNLTVGVAGVADRSITVNSAGGAGAVTGTLFTQPYGFLISSTQWMSMIAPGGYEQRTGGSIYYQDSDASNTTRWQWDSATGLVTQNGNHTISGGVLSVTKTGGTAGTYYGTFSGSDTWHNAVRLQNTSSGADYAFMLSGSGSNTPTQRFMIYDLATGGGERLTILHGGNVGIGVANPTALLHVAGTSLFTGTSTHTGSMIVKSVTDAGPMTATNGTVAEIVFNTSDSKFYGCTATGTPATWAALN